jgi:ABC-type dipeptide/oligopeptide/nickel transport system ATPase subunit
VRTVLKTENLTKSYSIGKLEVPALRGVSLEIGEGEFVGHHGAVGMRQVDVCFICWAGY